MQFQPKTEEEAKRFPLIPKGEYEFTVHSAEDKESSKHNDMIVLNIEIWDGEQSLGRVFDYLLEQMPAKLRHCCDTLGMLTEYEAGVLQASMFEGKAGRVEIGIKKATAEFPEKNFVVDYVCRPAKPLNGDKPKPTQKPKPQPEPATEEKDDLPF